MTSPSAGWSHRRNHHDVPLFHLIRRNILIPGPPSTRDARWSGASLAQRAGLGLASAFGHGFCKIREQHRKPEPEGDLQGEAERLAFRAKYHSKGGGAAPTSVTNITGFFSM